MGGIDYQKNLEELMKVCGSPGKCRSCGADIWWFFSRNKKVIPYTREGICHFADCPDAAQFRKGKHGK